MIRPITDASARDIVEAIDELILIRLDLGKLVAEDHSPNFLRGHKERIEQLKCKISTYLLANSYDDNR